ncbi:MAG: hypothetical protein QOF53_4007 [Nocardioidaceae bacterium]|jgi:hypothetical protein|nr:hypothetical protein [Nocardioidaceae bacterium]
MSESTPQSQGSAEGGYPDRSEPGLISDEQLPEDLRPEENPMAKDPDADDDAAPEGADVGSGAALDTDNTGPAGSAAGPAQDAPDPGQTGG